MKKTLIMFTMALLVMLALAACGGDDSGSNGGGDTADTAPAGEDSAAETGEDDGGEEAVAAGDAATGEELFQQTCSACHGPDAKGLPNLGKDLTGNEFVQEKSDEEMLAFVKEGRPAGDPLNDTGIDMPPKGGNPALADEDILHIIAYLRTLQE